MKQEHGEKIPFLSFLMTCLVVLYHCEALPELQAAGPKDLWWSQQITSVISGPLSSLFMCWFFGLTAFLLFHNLRFDNLGRKLLSRVKTLLVPYLLWQLLYSAKAFLQGQRWTPAQLLAKIFFLRHWPPLPALWYVYAVFLLALLSPIILLLFRREKIGFLFITATIVLLYAFWDTLTVRTDPPSYINNIKMYFPAYLVGAFFGHLYKEDGYDRLLAYAAALLLVGTALAPVIQGLLDKLALAVLPMLLLLVMPMPEWAKDRRVYKASFLIYATHESFISLLLVRMQKTIAFLLPYVSLTNLFSRFLCLLLIILFNLLIHRLMRRFCPRTLKLLTGGRC